MNIYHYIALGLFGAFVVAELALKGRDYPKVRGWPLIGLLSMATYMLISTLAPFLWARWLGAHRLFDLTALPLAVQAAIGLLVYELTMYWQHRLLHRSDVLWRLLHQTHHSAERVDIWGVFYFHPLDMLGWTLQGSLALIWIVGLTPEAALIVLVVATALNMLTHANIRTPHWLGWFVARPEMHAVHHERDVHAFNYCDLPVIDRIFGTYRNPKTWNGAVGLVDGGTTRFGDLLVGKPLV
jgi:sterol desaturase/sphingolipid hydroxylase (fatty acid hydroxylase superfamily)